MGEELEQQKGQKERAHESEVQDETKSSWEHGNLMEICKREREMERETETNRKV